jgi:serine/threonine protein kinase
MRETQAAMQLKHRHLVQIHGLGSAHGHHFCAMEYVEGEDLGLTVTLNGPLPIDQAVEYLRQAAEGLEFAHARGVVHGGVRPSNLLLSDDGILKLSDLGMAPLTRRAMASPQPQGSEAASPLDYQAPELAVDATSADPKADIYSLGCTLFTLLTGEAPYPGDSSSDRLEAHRRAPVPSLRARRRDVPERLDLLFQKMLAKDPQKRLPSASAVIPYCKAISDSLGTIQGRKDLLADLMQTASVPTELLLEALAAKSQSGPAPPSPTARPAHEPDPRPRQSRYKTGLGVPSFQWVFMGGIAVVAALAVTLGIWLMREPAPQQVAANDPPKKEAPKIEPNKEPEPKKEPELPKEEPPKEEPPKEEPKAEPEPPKEEPKPKKRPPPEDDADRRVAQWFLAGKCGNLLTHLGDDPMQMRSLSEPSQIPKEKFHITSAFIRRMPDDPQKLFEFPDLQRLDNIHTEHVPVGDDFVLSMQEIPRLKTVSINRGEITDKAIGHMKGIANLSTLYLTDNPKITAKGHEVVGSLANLTQLHIMGATPVNDATLVHISQLTKLGMLTLMSDAVTDEGLRVLSSLPVLFQLTLACRNITDDGLRHLLAMKRLKMLHLQDAKISSAGIAELVKLELTTLVVRSSSVTDDCLRQIGQMTELTWLGLDGCDKITNDGLRHLTKLRLQTLTLNLCRSISDAGLKHLAKLKALEMVLLTNTGVSAKGVAELKKSLPKCSVVWP